MNDVILERDGLRLVLAKESLAEPLAEYYRRNREFLREFEPEREEFFFTPDGQRDLLRQERERAERRKATASIFSARRSLTASSA